jgi:transposase-like protein
MNCPKCGSDRHGVKESVKRSDWVWRRRRCKACGHVWSTRELPTTSLRRFNARFQILLGDKYQNCRRMTADDLIDK